MIGLLDKRAGKMQITFRALGLAMGWWIILLRLLGQIGKVSTLAWNDNSVPLPWLPNWCPPSLPNHHPHHLHLPVWKQCGRNRRWWSVFLLLIVAAFCCPAGKICPGIKELQSGGAGLEFRRLRSSVGLWSGEGWWQNLPAHCHQHPHTSTSLDKNPSHWWTMKRLACQNPLETKAPYSSQLHGGETQLKDLLMSF